MDTVSKRIAHYAVSTPTESIPATALDQAKRGLLDTLASILAGAREPVVTSVAAYVRAGDGCPEATLIGHGEKAPVEGAALVNGTAAHALDYDDVSLSMIGHPSAPLLPAILAVAETHNSSGLELLAAYVIGMEIEARTGRWIGRHHYTLGWHATATFGTLGAAAASSRLLGLDVERAQAALGIAASSASGIRANFGTMTKPLHAGLAASNGLRAARLAAAGVTASQAALDGPDGFTSAFLGGQPPASEFEEPGEPLDLLTQGLSQKAYPCCYNTHRAVDATLELRDGIPDATDIDAIEVVISKRTMDPLIPNDCYPSTGLEAKFSLPYCVASALIDGGLAIGSFGEDSIQRDEVVALSQLVSVTEDSAGPAPGGPDRWAAVTIRSKDGTARTTRVDTARGDPSRPLEWDDLVRKMRDSASDLPSARTDELIRAIGNADRLPDVHALTDLL